MKTTFPDKLVITLFLQLAIASTAYSSKHSNHEHEEEKHHATENSHERVQHGTHEHGTARLTVAVMEQGLEIMLESPAANLYGFEHKAHNKEDLEIVNHVKEKLEAGDTLFKPNVEAKCQFTDIKLESEIASEHDEMEKHGDEHDHKKQDDDEHHAHGHDEEQKKDHDKHDEEKHKGVKDHHESHDHQNKESTHSDVDVAWAFKCEKPADLKSVETTLFSQFPNGFKHLNVEWITNNSAGTVKLEADGAITLSQ